MHLIGGGNVPKDGLERRLKGGLEGSSELLLVGQEEPSTAVEDVSTLVKDFAGPLLEGGAEAAPKEASLFGITAEHSGKSVSKR